MRSAFTLSAVTSGKYAIKCYAIKSLAHQNRRINSIVIAGVATGNEVRRNDKNRYLTAHLSLASCKIEIIGMIKRNAMRRSVNARDLSLPNDHVECDRNMVYGRLLQHEQKFYSPPFILMGFLVLSAFAMPKQIRNNDSLLDFLTN